MKQWALLLLPMAATLASVTIAEAQIVQIGPGYIRAPYVRIYRSPSGTAVRAPYTRVDVGGRVNVRTPGRRVYVDPYGTQRIVTPRQTTSDSSILSADLPMVERQRRLLASSVQRLDGDLGRLRGGGDWQTYLRMPTGVSSATRVSGSNEFMQPDPQAVDAVLSKFDFVVSREDYRKIYQLSSFRSTHRLLREYVVLLSLPTTNELEAAARIQPTPATPNTISPATPVPVSKPQPEELPVPITQPRSTASPSRDT